MQVLSQILVNNRFLFMIPFCLGLSFSAVGTASGNEPRHLTCVFKEAQTVRVEVHPQDPGQLVVSFDFRRGRNMGTPFITPGTCEWNDGQQVEPSEPNVVRMMIPNKQVEMKFDGKSVLVPEAAPWIYVLPQHQTVQFPNVIISKEGFNHPYLRPL